MCNFHLAIVILPGIFEQYPDESAVVEFYSSVTDFAETNKTNSAQRSTNCVICVGQGNGRIFSQVRCLLSRRWRQDLPAAIHWCTFYGPVQHVWSSWWDRIFFFDMQPEMEAFLSTVRFTTLTCHSGISMTLSLRLAGRSVLYSIIQSWKIFPTWTTPWELLNSGGQDRVFLLLAHPGPWAWCMHRDHRNPLKVDGQRRSAAE